MATRRKKRRKLKIGNLFILILLALLIFTGYKKVSSFFKKNETVNKIFNNEEYEKKKEEERKLKEYNKCLVASYDESDLSENLKNKENEVTTYIKNNYRASIVYEDMTTGYTYKLNENQTYYGASLIKIVEALYLLDKANNNEIDLDNETIKYESKYVHGFSTGMKTRKVGEDVTLRDLIRYAITYSDNSAHFMLSNYIGTSNLKEYAKGLGATAISVVPGDTFGNQTAVDTNIYLHHAYKLIKQDNENGKFLKEIMCNNDTNALNLTGNDNITIGHKYGQYDTYYHDIGISFNDSPYYVSVLTSHGRGDYIKIVNNISSKIKELHDTFHEERENKCHTQIYGS